MKRHTFSGSIFSGATFSGSIFLLTVGFLLVSVLPAEAFRMIQPFGNGRWTAGDAVACNDPGGFAHWTNLEVGWRLNQANQGAGMVTPTRNAVETWNDVTQSGYVLDYEGTTNAGWATDGINTILWANGNGCTGNCIGLTALVIQNGDEIIESDVTMNNNVTWTTNGAQYDGETVILHELGHALGIHHSDVANPRPVMAGTGYSGSVRSLTNDDREALRCSYDEYHPCTGAPPRPQYITGPNHDLCQGEVEVYQTPHVPGAESYRWEIVGQSWTRTTNSNEVSISGWYFNPGTYTLRVRAQNPCGNSAWRQANIIVRSNSHPSCGGCSGRFCF